MLATEFFFSQTFYLRTPDKHTKSQQKSTHAKYEKIQVLFFHHFSLKTPCFYANYLYYSCVLQKISFLIVFNICNFQKSVINRRIYVSAHYWNQEKHLMVCKVSPPVGYFGLLTYVRNQRMIIIPYYKIFHTQRQQVS